MEDYEPLCWNTKCKLDDMHVPASVEYVRVPEVKSVYDPVHGPLGIDGLATFRVVGRVTVRLRLGVYRRYCEDCAKELLNES